MLLKHELLKKKKKMKLFIQGQETLRKIISPKCVDGMWRIKANIKLKALTCSTNGNQREGEEWEELRDGLKVWWKMI